MMQFQTWDSLEPTCFTFQSHFSHDTWRRTELSSSSECIRRPHCWSKPRFSHLRSRESRYRPTRSSNSHRIVSLDRRERRERSHLYERAYDSKLKRLERSQRGSRRERGSLLGIRPVAWALTVHRTPQNVRLFQVKFSPSCSLSHAPGDLPPVTTSGHLCHLAARRGRYIFVGIVGHRLRTVDRWWKRGGRSHQLLARTFFFFNRDKHIRRLVAMEFPMARWVFNYRNCNWRARAKSEIAKVLIHYRRIIWRWYEFFLRKTKLIKVGIMRIAKESILLYRSEKLERSSWSEGRRKERNEEESGFLIVLIYFSSIVLFVIIQVDTQRGCK